MAGSTHLARCSRGIAPRDLLLRSNNSQLPGSIFPKKCFGDRRNECWTADSSTRHQEIDVDHTRRCVAQHEAEPQPPEEERREAYEQSGSDAVHVRDRPPSTQCPFPNGVHEITAPHEKPQCSRHTAFGL